MMKRKRTVPSPEGIQDTIIPSIPWAFGNNSPRSITWSIPGPARSITSWAADWWKMAVILASAGPGKDWVRWRKPGASFSPQRLQTQKLKECQSRQSSHHQGLSWSSLAPLT